MGDNRSRTAMKPPSKENPRPAAIVEIKATSWGKRETFQAKRPTLASAPLGRSKSGAMLPWRQAKGNLRRPATLRRQACAASPFRH